MHNIQPVSCGFSSTVMPALWLSEELHPVRHPGAGGEEIHPQREDSSGGSPDRPSAPILSGQCSTEKASVMQDHFQGTQTRGKGKAEHGRPHRLGPQSTGPVRPDTTPWLASYTAAAQRLKPLLRARTQGETTALSHPLCPPNLLPSRCWVGLKASRSPEVYITQFPSFTDYGSSTPSPVWKH